MPDDRRFATALLPIEKLLNYGICTPRACNCHLAVNPALSTAWLQCAPAQSGPPVVVLLVFQLS